MLSEAAALVPFPTQDSPVCHCTLVGAADTPPTPTQHSPTLVRTRCLRCLQVPQSAAQQLQAAATATQRSSKQQQGRTGVL